MLPISQLLPYVPKAGREDAGKNGVGGWGSWAIPGALPAGYLLAPFQGSQRNLAFEGPEFNDVVVQLQAAIAAEENVRVVLDAAQHERINAMIQVHDAVEGFCR